MSTTTSYNLDRQVTLVSRPDGDFITPQYDPTSGRLQSVSTAAGTTTFGYKTTTGQLQSIAAPGETLTYGYDGSLLTSVAWSGAVSGSLARTYDSSFRVASETVAGTTINYSYDNDDLLTQAGDLHIPRDPATGFVGSGTTLGTLQEATTYDAFGALQTYTVNSCPTAPCTTLYSVDYGTRDALGRIVHKTEAIQGQTHTYDYGYDLNGRLVDVFNDGVAPGSTAWSSAATYAAGALVSSGGIEYASLLASNTNHPPPNAAWWQPTHAYAYDANGNRLAAPNLVGTPVYDTQDRMLSYGSCSYAYKNDGSLQIKTCPDGTTTYDYDAFGNLRHVGLPNGTAIDYVIDGQNRRVGKKVNGVLVEGFLYRGQLQPSVWLASDGITAKAVFVYGLKPNVPEYMIQGSATYRLITDQIGSVRLVENVATGVLAERIDYDEFGNVLADSAPGFQPFGFAGGLFDRDTGFTHFGARDYDALRGRWLSKDPLGFGSASHNFYDYAGADSVNAGDPTGRATCYYSIAGHTMVCAPNSPGESPGRSIGPDNVFSGVAGCRNDPSCSGRRDWGPIPPGRYNMHPDDRPGHESFWRLEPDPKVKWWEYYLFQKRNGFEMHPGGVSLGCITTDKNDAEAMHNYMEMNDFLLNDQPNILIVHP